MNFINKVISKIKREKSLNVRIARLKRQRILLYEKKAALQANIDAQNEAVQQLLNGGNLKAALPH